MKIRATRRSGISVLAVTALAVSLLAVGGSQPARAAALASIVGTVTADDGSGPLAYPQVNLYQRSGTAWKWFDFREGGTNGTYGFHDLPAGTYTLEFGPRHGDNFVEEWWGDQPALSTAATIALSSAATISNVTADASLARGGVISGTITVPAALPSPAPQFTPDPDISLLVSDGKGGWNDTGLWTTPTPLTGTTRQYSIVGIPPGKYTLFYGDDASQSDYVPLFYGAASTGATEPWNADPITLTAGQIFTGANASYRHGATGNGRVTNYAGTALSGVTVTFYRYVLVNGTYKWQNWSTSTNASGAFRETSMPPGSWTVEYTKSGYTTVDSPVSGTFALTYDQQKTMPTVKMYKKLTTAAPTISGTRRVGYLLTLSRGTWTAGTTFSYAWYANGVYISGSAGHTTFKLTSAQRGKTITVKVTGKKTGYTTVTRTSAATAKIS